jgi:regulator of protease activity HflC (stomatin/prohibitin superfamily)
MKEKTLALTNQINAETEVKYNEILAEANIIETEILANARAQAAKLRAEADAYEVRTITECERENADTIAQAINIEGEIEKRMLNGSKKKRKHLQIMERLNAMETLSHNRNMIIYGEQGNNLAANLEAFRLIERSK